MFKLSILQNFFFLGVLIFLSPSWAQKSESSALFKQAVAKFEAKSYVDSEKLLRSIEPDQFVLPEYHAFYLGRVLFELEQYQSSAEQFEKVIKGKSNTRLDLDSNYYLGMIALENKKFAEARRRFQLLERRSRRQEIYPDIIYQLVRAELGLVNRAPACRWLRKLYTDHPQFEKTQSWGAQLSQNQFEGKATQCSHTREDLRSRIKNLQWAGLSEKALSEIQSLRSQSSAFDIYDVDRLEIGFHIHEGEVRKALDMLIPYYEQKKSDYNYLNQLATAAARAGESAVAVGAYYRAYKTFPNSKHGRQALFQAAFMSYQYQDYDGATRKFQEFTKRYKNSGLARDAQWHLAWIRYLRQDYKASYASMKSLLDQAQRQRRPWRNFSRDRVVYWMGMSLYRQEKLQEARPYFESLQQDRLLGYYSVAAHSRLKRIDSELSKNKSTRRLAWVRPAFSVEMLEIPEDVLRQQAMSIPENFDVSAVKDLPIEEESEALLTQTEEANETGDEESTDNLATRDQGIQLPSFSNPELVAKFNRAQSLIEMGLTDWAKWELYEIERRTSKKEYLQLLMKNYEAVGSYHRSSYIAQINFGSQRGLHGVEGARYLWESAFPQAYKDSVQKYGRSFSLPSEYIWAIMRAESHYRHDVISPVGALGLMQVMPFTGQRVANLLKEKSFDPRSLLEPDTAIKIGGKYLQRLSNKFDANLAMIAAGYNAGPHRVKNWVSNFGNLDLDEWIEHIPFVETRNYVKKVVANANVYSVLYNNRKTSFDNLSSPLNFKLLEPAPTKETWEDI